MQELGNRNGQSREPTGERHAPKPVLSAKALQGLPGTLVRTIDPYTEAHQAAVLFTILVMFGNVIGRSAYFKVEESNHYTNPS